MTQNLTYHMRDKKHIDRMLPVIMKIGWGEVWHERFVEDEQGSVWFQMTTTGLVVIRDKAKRKIVTAYVPTQNQIDGICFKLFNLEYTPDWIWYRAKKNLQMVKKFNKTY